MSRAKKRYLPLFLLIISVMVTSCVAPSATPATSIANKIVPHNQEWGIYSLDLATETVKLLYTSSNEIAFLTLNNTENRFAFSEKIEGNANEYTEICTIDVDGNNFRRLTTNEYWDIYPAWSPDTSKIAFLSFRDTNLDIYIMNYDDGNAIKLYDSGSHDADIHWVGNKIVFTAYSRVWSIRDDGTEPKSITDPPDAGEWGNANLPFGDYDPRISPNGNKIVFERLFDDTSPHGNYDIYSINSDGSGEVALTNTGYSQGFASWSQSGQTIVYIVAAIGNEGQYDIYTMSNDGSNHQNITPQYFPRNFLCHTPLFSQDDSKIFFIGQWWK
ncbi:TolB family protein [Chloroflexota bacterium]